MMTVKKEIFRFINGKKEKISDALAEEKYLRIFVNEKEFTVVLISPYNIEYFIYGFLFTFNLIDNIEEVENLKIFKQFCYVTIRNGKKLKSSKNYGEKINSGCGNYYPINLKEKITTDIKICGEKIINIVNEFQKKSEIFKLTGAVHSCALSDGEKIIFFADDIGRHNAFDKIIGEAIYKKTSLDDKIVITSGRITSEIVFKSVRAKIPVLVSISAVTDYAFKIAENFGITLCGFTRGRRFNIYTFPERIF